MPDENDTDQHDDQQDPEIDFTDTSDIQSWPRLDSHIAALLNEGADDAWADARRGPSEEREANLTKSVDLKERSTWVADTGVVRPEDLEALMGTGREDAMDAVAEWERREAETAETERLVAEEAAKSDEDRAREAAEKAAFEAQQGLEDQIQALINETSEALTEPDAPSVRINMFADGEDGTRITTVSRSEGEEVVSHVGLEKAVPFDAAYKRATKRRVGLFKFKDLADVVSTMPAAARPAWWAQRSVLEREVLARGFGLREPLSEIPEIPEEGGQS
jgi:hypothetical protein